MPTLEEIAATFRFQGNWCHRLGSDIYGRLLEGAADDIEARGRIADIVAGWEGNPLTDAMPLRLMGAVHRRVLSGQEPELAAHYPSAGGTPRWPQAWEAFIAAVTAHPEEMKAGLARGVQTNEVNRSAILLGGFLRIGAETGLPLRVREIGASAGLNQFWDLYRYELQGAGSWGNPQSPVCLRAVWEGGADVLGNEVSVSSRLGCDLAPIDIGDDESVRTLESFIWPDQAERLRVFRAAAAMARREGPRIDRMSAAAWLEGQLADLPEGEATVVFHSIMWWYMPEAEREAVAARIAAAGARATRRSPVAWLRLEALKQEGADLRLNLWPGGEERLLADEASPHGMSARWLDRG